MKGVICGNKIISAFLKATSEERYQFMEWLRRYIKAKEKKNETNKNTDKS